MKALIIDDEKNSTELTHHLLKSYCQNVRVVATGSSVEEGYSLIVKHQPDLVFLDVQMQDGTGFDLLNRFDSIEFKIVFITAYQEFAIHAFRRSAIDYLLKPLSPPDIIDAVNKANHSTLNNDWNIRLKTLLSGIGEIAPQRRKIVLKTLERIYSLPLSDIVRLHSEGSYTEVFLKDGKKIVVSRLLKEFDELLSPSGFIRVHQSHLVNIDFIFCYAKSESNVTMKDETVIPVSVRKKEALLNLLNSG